MISLAVAEELRRRDHDAYAIAERPDLGSLLDRPPPSGWCEVLSERSAKDDAGRLSALGAAEFVR